MPHRKIYFADLTHTAQGISAATFPLGVSFVVSYARQRLGENFSLKLFKFPSDLNAALMAEKPDMLCFSSYSWNRELSYRIASLAKTRWPDLIVVFGGPNFPTDSGEKKDMLCRYSAIDFYVELEGELGFHDLVLKLDQYGFSANRLKHSGEKVLNSVYAAGGEIVCGNIERITDLDALPSPYLTGVLDEFFGHPLVPMLETTRGCPFACTFCADGIATKNKVARFDRERVREELEYIARRLSNVDELIITDLNFAMYREDVFTAHAIADVRERFGWPTIISASAGKNKPHRTINIASILKGSWTLGASIQSTDPRILKAIKRSNISSEAYRELIDYGNSLENSKTHSEVILGLPEDSRERHFESLRFGIENRVNSMRMFQAMLLSGTEMATPEARRKHGLVSRFRTIPGCVGMYEFFGEKWPVSEIEEIVVGGTSLPFEDYVQCRIMNLVVETFYNNSMFDELFAAVRAIGGSVFECLLYVHRNPECYTPRITEIIDGFVRQTGSDLYDSFEQAQSSVLTPEVIEKYIGGELGINELLVHKALLVSEFEEICALIFAAALKTLEARGLATAAVQEYLAELKTFTILRKRNVLTEDARYRASFRYDFPAIAKHGFEVKPDDLQTSSPPVEIAFFHDERQKRHIGNQRKIYLNTPIGLGRLMQRSNMKLMYRSFERVASGAE